MRPSRLRPVDAYPIQEGERTFLALRDAEGFSSRLLLLSAADAAVACRLDGKATAEDIAEDISRQAGEEFPVRRVHDLVKVLDENLMLESERFLKHRAKVVADFRKAPSRPAFLAGQSYLDKPEALSEALDEILALAPAPEGREHCGRLTGLVAPHIDFQRGKEGYARSYGELLAAGPADLYVVLGVAHASPPTPFVLADKDYETPLGPLPVDRDLARALTERAPYDVRADEFVHRTEHSIEFQAVFLRHAALRLKASPKMLPILCSSCELEEGGAGERTLGFLQTLEELLGSYRGTVCLLAGVDFAHIGPRFGDEEPVSPKSLRETGALDRRSIERLLEGDPEGFIDSVLFDGNKRRVCGVSALHAFSWLQRRLAPESCGELLHYGHAADPAGGEVTFASLAFREPASPDSGR